MLLAEGILLHVDSEACVFDRIWCCFEIYVSLTRPELALDIVAWRDDGSSRRPVLLSEDTLPDESTRTQVLREEAFPIAMLQRGLRTRLQDGHATVQHDRRVILDYIAGSVDQANASLHGLLARVAWRPALMRGLVEDFDQDQPGTLSLARVLHDDVMNPRLHLNLSFLDVVNRLALQAVCEGFPANLTDLKLAFQSCVHVDDDGFELLSVHLPTGLKVFHLDCIGCQGITNHGLALLAKGLPRGLAELTLNFDGCESISEEGIRAMTRALPRTVKKFRGTFHGTPANCGFASLHELRVYAAGNKRMLQLYKNLM
uniref:Uncharacterized protein n=1 Tax=Zooxanthella nutricula TaxID=1333877 RepID=A0A7S2PTQ1_9DINO